MLTSLCACTGTESSGDAATRDESMPKKLLLADLEGIPLATDEMTPQQRRQLCLDFFELQLGFQWKTDMDVSFMMSNYKKGTYKELNTQDVLGGIVYHSHGYGNLYRWLEYYDEHTGVMAMEKALAENGGYGDGAAITHLETDENGDPTYFKYRSLMALGNQCSSSSCWSWGRVINSACFGDTCDLNIYNGFIPVGCYSYGYELDGKYYGPMDIQKFGKGHESNPGGYDTPDVIKDLIEEKGINAMFDCYALMKPGDCLVDEGHALMVKQVNLFKGKDGSVDYDLSSVIVNEQIEAWDHEGTILDAPYKQQGRIDHAYSFKQLQEDAYIPFTFLELLDENDPVDKEHLAYYQSYAKELTALQNRYKVFPFREEMNSASVEPAVTYCSYEGEQISPTDFSAMTVGANYSISDVFVTVTGKDGAVLLKNIFRAPFTNYREVTMDVNKSTWEQDSDGSYLPISHGLDALATGENTVTVSLQLSTGQLLTAYEGTLKG